MLDSTFSFLVWLSPSPSPAPVAPSLARWEKDKKSFLKDTNSLFEKLRWYVQTLTCVRANNCGGILPISLVDSVFQSLLTNCIRPQYAAHRGCTPWTSAAAVSPVPRTSERPAVDLSRYVATFYRAKTRFNVFLIRSPKDACHHIVLFQTAGTCARDLRCLRQCECKTNTKKNCIFPFTYEVTPFKPTHLYEVTGQRLEKQVGWGTCLLMK